MSPIAELASYRDIPVFSWLANEEILDDKDKLTTFVRVVYPLSQLGKDYGWCIYDGNNLEENLACMSTKK